MTEMYNMRRSRISEPGASDFSESESDQYGAVVIRPNYKKRLTRQIDEGVLNLKQSDFSASGQLSEVNVSDSESEGTPRKIKVEMVE